MFRGNEVNNNMSLYMIVVAGQGAGWMQAPQPPPNCPPGLEYLTMVDQLLIHQQVELLEGKLLLISLLVIALKNKQKNQQNKQNTHTVLPMLSQYCPPGLEYLTLEKLNCSSISWLNYYKG